MTQTILYIQAQALCAVLLVVLFSFLNHYEVGKQKRIKWIYVLTFFAVVTDALCVIFAPVCMYAHVLYTALVGGVGFLWFVHCVRRRYRALADKVWLHLVALLPAITMRVFALICGKNYGLYIGYIYVAVLWIFMIIGAVTAELKRHKKECLLSALLVLPAALGGLVKLLWLPQGLSLFGYGVLVALTVLFARTLYRKTRTDKLTKLSNREGMEDEFREQLSQYKRDKNDLFYVIACDMDRFKLINDEYGHDIGNEALCLVSEVMIAVAEKYEAEAFRIGGDEFVIIMDTDDEEAVRRICQELRDGFAQAKQKQSKPYKLLMSVGYELYDGESDTEELLKRADAKLYDAKKNRE